MASGWGRDLGGLDQRTTYVSVHGTQWNHDTIAVYANDPTKAMFLSTPRSRTYRSANGSPIGGTRPCSLQASTGTTGS
jgi:hypothetical protein